MKEVDLQLKKTMEILFIIINNICILFYFFLILVKNYNSI